MKRKKSSTPQVRTRTKSKLRARYQPGTGEDWGGEGSRRDWRDEIAGTSWDEHENGGPR